MRKFARLLSISALALAATYAPLQAHETAKVVEPPYPPPQPGETCLDVYHTAYTSPVGDQTVFCASQFATSVTFQYFMVINGNFVLTTSTPLYPCAAAPLETQQLFCTT